MPDATLQDPSGLGLGGVPQGDIWSVLGSLGITPSSLGMGGPQVPTPAVTAPASPMAPQFSPNGVAMQDAPGPQMPSSGYQGLGAPSPASMPAPAAMPAAAPAPMPTAKPAATQGANDQGGITPFEFPLEAMDNIHKGMALMEKGHGMLPPNLRPSMTPIQALIGAIGTALTYQNPKNNFAQQFNEGAASQNATANQNDLNRFQAQQGSALAQGQALIQQGQAQAQIAENIYKANVGYLGLQNRGLSGIQEQDKTKLLINAANNAQKIAGAFTKGLSDQTKALITTLPNLSSDQQNSVWTLIQNEKGPDGQPSLLASVPLTDMLANLQDGGKFLNNLASASKNVAQADQTNALTQPKVGQINADTALKGAQAKTEGTKQDLNRANIGRINWTIDAQKQELPKKLANLDSLYDMHESQSDYLDRKTAGTAAAPTKGSLTGPGSAAFTIRLTDQAIKDLRNEQARQAGIARMNSPAQQAFVADAAARSKMDQARQNAAQAADDIETQIKVYRSQANKLRATYGVVDPNAEDGGETAEILKRGGLPLDKGMTDMSGAFKKKGGTPAPGTPLQLPQGATEQMFIDKAKQWLKPGPNGRPAKDRASVESFLKRYGISMSNVG